MHRCLRVVRQLAVTEMGRFEPSRHDRPVDRFRRTGEVRGIATEFPLSAHQAAIRSPAEQGGRGVSISDAPWASNRTGLTRRFFSLRQTFDFQLD